MYKIVLIIPLIFFLTSCSGNNIDVPNTSEQSSPGLFSKNSDEGLSLSELLSGKDNSEGIVNVNAFLWRASLNILSIAPLISTDSLGGTIISDWYINKNINNQRLKITAYILSQELRSNGIKVTVHIQNYKNNVWSETFKDDDLSNKIEEKILNEARNLRVSALNKK